MMNAFFLANMQHSHPQITLYREVIYFELGCKNNRQGLIINHNIISSSLASISTPSSVGLAMLVYSSHTENYNKNLGINCFLGLPSIET